MCMLDGLLSFLIAAAILWLAVTSADSLTRLAPDTCKPLFGRLCMSAGVSQRAASQAAC